MTDALYDSVISQLTEAPVQFGLIPPEHWNQPSWIDEDRASASRDKLVSEDVIYGGECLCNSGSFADVLHRVDIVGELRSPGPEC
jgi:alpha 1,2-mannosyltransferase